MKNLLVVLVVVFVSLSAVAQGYTKAELKKLERDKQYQTLSTYYGNQHKDFVRKAADEKIELDRRTQGVVAGGTRSIAPARNLYEYYMWKADETGKLEAKYATLAQ